MSAPTGIDGDAVNTVAMDSFNLGHASGSFTHVLEDGDYDYDRFVYLYERFAGELYERFAGARAPLTMTVSCRTPWWKRPWCWLRRRPTSWELTVTDVVFSDVVTAEDGVVGVAFTGRDVEGGIALRKRPR